MIKFIVKENNNFLIRKKFLNKFLVLEDNFQFFSNVKNQSFFLNSSRETHNNRLNKTHKIISNNINIEKENDILDIGVSDGSTAINLYNYLLEKRYSFNFTISEIILEINHYDRSFISIFSDENFNIFKYSIFNIILDKNLNIFKYPISRIFFYIFLPTASILNNLSKKIMVFNDDTNDLLSRNMISKTRLDIFDIKDKSKKYDLVRSFNILNHQNYRKKIRKVLIQIKKILKKDAIFICGYHFSKKIFIYVYKNQIDGIKLIEKNEFF
ncbi:hypothetical protein OAS25_02875 [Alphaproteobacteria bacterium]|nr:hypothetical protein [Alphaproteobacteria bacterium]